MNSEKYFIGIDLGGTNIAAGVVDKDGNIIERAERKTMVPRPYEEIFEDMVCAAREAADKSGISMEKIESVGIGTPGVLDREKGLIEFAGNLNFYNAPISEYIGNALDKKIYIENDANAAAWGEFVAGSGRNINDFVMITLGTGVGGGIISDGKLVRGAYGNGAEIGHMSLIANGIECSCGRKGCFEAYASATALIRQTQEAMGKNPNSDLWRICDGNITKVNGQTAFLANDETAKKVVDTYLGYLSEGVLNIAALLQPEMICIGGGISNEGEKILKPIRECMKGKSFTRFGKKQTAVNLAKLGGKAGIVGAALLWKCN